MFRVTELAFLPHHLLTRPHLPAWRQRDAGVAAIRAVPAPLPYCGFNPLDPSLQGCDSLSRSHASPLAASRASSSYLSPMNSSSSSILALSASASAKRAVYSRTVRAAEILADAGVSSFVIMSRSTVTASPDAAWRCA